MSKKWVVKLYNNLKKWTLNMKPCILRAINDLWQSPLDLCIMLAMAIGRVKEKRPDLMRSLVKTAWKQKTNCIFEGRIGMPKKHWYGWFYQLKAAATRYMLVVFTDYYGFKWRFCFSLNIFANSANSLLCDFIYRTIWYYIVKYYQIWCGKLLILTFSTPWERLIIDVWFKILTLIQEGGIRKKEIQQ